MNKLYLYKLLLTVLTVSFFAVLQAQTFKLVRSAGMPIDSGIRLMPSYRYIDTINNNFVFGARDGASEGKLWATNGTDDGTFLLGPTLPATNSTADLNDGYFGKRPRFKGEDYFFAKSASDSIVLWKTKGLPGTTNIVAGIMPDSGFDFAKTWATDNYLFIVERGQTNNPQKDTIRDRLYAWDGINAPVLIKKGDYFDNPSPNCSGLTIGNEFYFFNYVFDNAGDGSMDLWKSDGTSAGTVLVKTLYSDQAGFWGDPFVTYMIEYKGQLFFIVNDRYTNTLDLWKSDGTEAGTMMFPDFNLRNMGGPPTIANDKLYFVASSPNSYDEQLWVTDGTIAGCHKINFDLSFGESIGLFINFKDSLYFIVSSTSGNEQWKTDGTDAGTTRCLFNPLGEYPLVTGGGKLYFALHDTIFQSDGSVAGTVMLGALKSDGLDSVAYIEGLRYLNGRLFFVGDNSTFTYNRLYTTTQSLLPVTLLSFTGQLQGNNSLLNWATANEQNNRYFNVQRSTNGVAFNTIGRVNAQAGLKVNNYSYVDANITAAGISKLYYRLQQVDLDGKFTYSNTIQLNVALSNLLHVAPNPATGFTNLYSAINITGAAIQVVDMSGRVLYAAKQNITAGSKINIPLAGYAKGVYSVTVQGSTTQKMEYKLVIQ